jgi:hypothetical protein
MIAFGKQELEKGKELFSMRFVFESFIFKTIYTYNLEKNKIK